MPLDTRLNRQLCVASARLPRLVVLHAVEELPDNVVRPLLHEFLVVQPECMLQAQQREHQTNRQSPTPRAPTPAPTISLVEPKKSAPSTYFLAILVRERRRQHNLDRCLRHPRCQHRQRVRHGDLRVQAGAEEVVGRRRGNL